MDGIADPHPPPWWTETRAAPSAAAGPVRGAKNPILIVSWATADAGRRKKIAARLRRSVPRTVPFIIPSSLF